MIISFHFVHQVLDHFPNILAKLPPTFVASMLSEEGSEAANKDIKDAEKNNAMKSSDLTILEQTFHRRMDISDVVIQSYSQVLLVLEFHVVEIVSICMYKHSSFNAVFWA